MGKPIVCVQPIFCPTRTMTDFNKASTESFAKYLEAYPADVDLVFGGYMDEDFEKEMLAILKEHFSGKCKFFRFDRNYGKAHVVNDMVSRYLQTNPDAKWMFTFDSDILFLESEPNALQRLQTVADELPAIQGMPTGLVACNFDDSADNAHWLHQMNQSAVIGEETVRWPERPVGIAGGCIFVNIEAWKKIGGYRIMGVYAPDDAVLIQDLHRNGYGMCVLETLHVFHPGTHDDEHYQSWKAKTSQTRMTMAQSMEHCKKFWEEKRTMENPNLRLKNVTLAMVECIDLDRALKAVEYSTRDIDFGEIKIFTSLDTDSPYAVKIDPITSKEAYSEFCIKGMNEHIDTDYVLLMQYDGFLIGGQKAWKDEFLNYDYIGAPWWYEDGMNVGNGGFSLRSKKLLVALQDSVVTEFHPEDHHICRTYRKLLEGRGIKFAPEDLAAQFAIEWSNKTGFKYTGQLGFHGFDILYLNRIPYDGIKMEEVTAVRRGVQPI